MKKGLLRMLKGTLSVLLVLALMLLNVRPEVYTEKEKKDPVVVVSLGDSYSSGEGIEPFYGQTEAPIDKTDNPDWLAHRSMKSWAGLIEIPIDGNKTSGPMNQYRVSHDGTREYQTKSDDFKWYFVAASGATTKEFYDIQQKPYKRWFDGRPWEGSYPLPAQLKVFDKIEDTVDYVTFTIGGNDVGFFNVVYKAAMGFAILGSTGVKEFITKTWRAFDYGTEDDPEPIKEKIKKAYKAVAEKAPEAAILVVGYPKLFSTKWYNYATPFLIDILEAKMINEAVSQFNNRLEALVEECRKEGYNIHFVDVETEFDGHEAGSMDSWLNLFTVPYQKEDLEELPYSCYSMHPNETGAIHYAKCVNKKIAEIEKKKREEQKTQESAGESGAPEGQYYVIKVVERDGSEVDFESEEYIVFNKDGTGYVYAEGEKDKFRWTKKNGSVTINFETFSPARDTSVVFTIEGDMLVEKQTVFSVEDIEAGRPGEEVTLYWGHYQPTQETGSHSGVSGEPVSVQKWAGTWVSCENDTDRFTVNSDDTVTINGTRFSVELYKSSYGQQYCYVKAKDGSGLWYDVCFGVASLFYSTSDEITVNSVNGAGKTKKIRCGAYRKEGADNPYQDFFGTWTAQSEAAAIDGLTITSFSIERDGTFRTGEVRKSIQFEHAYAIVADNGMTFSTTMPGFYVAGTHIHGQFEPMLYYDYLTIRVNDKPYLYRKN